MKAILGEPNLVYCVPVNENTKKWGVYSIPRMWRDISGDIVIRFNGEMDTGDVDNMQIVPNLYFVSRDNGKTWEQIHNGEEKYNTEILNGIGNPYTVCPDSVIAYREKRDVQPIENVPFQKQFILPDGEALVNSYRYGDIPEKSKGMERLMFCDGVALGEAQAVDFDFPEREILINAKGHNGEEFVYVEQKVRQCVFKNTYFTEVTSVGGDNLVAVACGQHPEVADRYCGVAYLIESNDLGITWHKKSDIAIDSGLKYGYTGDSHEVTLVRTAKGNLMCAMRMDMSINPDIEKPICDTMVAVSTDGGNSFCKPFSVSDSSVTPQLVSFENGVVALVYGRPGVHLKFTVDDGKVWSEPITIIGKTLSQNRQEGISDVDSKYFDTVSYSNSFTVKVSDNSMIVLYTDLKYDPGDGQKHKAAFVRTVTFE